MLETIARTFSTQGGHRVSGGCVDRLAARGGRDVESCWRELASGPDRSCVIGTHALFEVRGPSSSKLGLAVVDEQHRFGVMQRAALAGKGPRPDVLVMTATPIPRSLALTMYGDLDISVIDELPPNRRPIKTVVRGERDRERVYAGLARELARGGQAYIVVPLVEETAKSDLKAATEFAEHLRTRALPQLADRIGSRGVSVRNSHMPCRSGAPQAVRGSSFSPPAWLSASAGSISDTATATIHRVEDIRPSPLESSHPSQTRRRTPSRTGPSWAVGVELPESYPQETDGSTVYTELPSGGVCALAQRRSWRRWG